MSLEIHRTSMRLAIRQPEFEAVEALITTADLTPTQRTDITDRAIALVKDIRSSGTTSMMELFLEEYGLSTDEGVALMCLAEALLRVPDTATIDALIEDKIVPSEWGKHLGQSASSLVNASTWALLITGTVLDDQSHAGVGQTLRHAIKRLGEPVIRRAVARAMREMGAQFVLGRTIEEALENGKEAQKQGYRYSFDMLGEAARTDADAKRYHLAYSDAISELAKHALGDSIADNPGISVKLSALYPRYEQLKQEKVMEILVPRTRSLALLAKSAGIGFNIDAEEADRLDLSLDVIEAVLSDPSLADWDGFGVVVQAYGKRAAHVLDWLYALAQNLDRQIMVRLVKGAYWDTEIKQAQVLGLDGFPVFTNKCATDVSYMACAKKLLAMGDRIYPQFATHNARTVAAVLDLARNSGTAFEFQRLHGMGEALHGIVQQQHGTRCRIYAPVGAHRDLLAYLVRRLLENGANSSFVNQIVDVDVPAEVVAADPFVSAMALPNPAENSSTQLPPNLYQPQRPNSMGRDLTDPMALQALWSAREAFASKTWGATSLLANKSEGGATQSLFNPATPTQPIGHVIWATQTDVAQAAQAAKPWSVPAAERAKILSKAADLYEENAAELFAILAREAGKTLIDCEAELREAVDFLRYYAAQAEQDGDSAPRGTVLCISPWNFPAAIFTGQIAAALATGNAVLAKPAEQTPITGWFCATLMQRAGVPATAFQVLQGKGADIGAALSALPTLNATCFTGSTATAQTINRAMAQHAPADAPLIAETGGLNAMIVDSSALPEQVVRDVLASAFQSAGQRCSALRCLYIQEDIAAEIKTMLFGAMDLLEVGDPWAKSCDIGPIIDTTAQKKITDYVAKSKILKAISAPQSGCFVGPVALEVTGIADLKEEVFGPVLHIATYQADALPKVISDINATGYGLTFGMHSRIDSRVETAVQGVQAGNIYINRNQIGAIVGSQPFGGTGLSGTGPKAGGPNYLNRFRATPALLDLDPVIHLPGPTGESNTLHIKPRGAFFCAGPTDADRHAQKALVHGHGCPVTSNMADAHAVLFWGEADAACELRQTLAAQDGPIVPLIVERDIDAWWFEEHHVCIDTTAAGGNAALLGD
ncbi:bifunctional proline dehydrogenase/L-glutamate gamma-semialdehyde dehydrogenase PutA [Algirhabdus cladophorae]|uniref:bifunctional proline dehydrogenase/L-glutamate gamma-semialdehyde dehydrogenase PutA n=1 Tax=Algirhabdus cladophorae TaxID=3377108 RepID=UPI003B84709C